MSLSAGQPIPLLTDPSATYTGPLIPVTQASPALPPHRNVKNQRQKLYEEVLEATNCTSLACLRKVSESTLLAANEYLINVAPSTGGGGNFGPVIGFSPVVDGDYVPDLPGILLRQGRFHKSVQSLIIGNMKEEVEENSLFVLCILPSLTKFRVH